MQKERGHNRPNIMSLSSDLLVQVIFLISIQIIAKEDHRELSQHYVERNNYPINHLICNNYFARLRTVNIFIFL